MVLGSVLAFFLPLVTALGGALLASHKPIPQLGGGVGGLLVGMMMVRLVLAVGSRFRWGESA